MGIEAAEQEITYDKIVTKLLYSQGNGASGDALLGKGSHGKTHFKKRKCYNCGSNNHLSNNCDKPKKENSKKNTSGHF